jgi:uncharacterized protein YprB with RNaseH-like and TPR domain
LENTSNRETAKELGLPRRSVDYTINTVIARAEAAGEISTVETPKILFCDIETAPMLSYLWSFWQNGVNHRMQEDQSYVLSWAAKWMDNEKIFEDYNDTGGPDIRVLEGMWLLLDDADFVVAHNGDKFDIKKLNTMFLLAGMRPPSPYKQIDTLKMLKRCFSFDSNRLDYVVNVLYGEEKKKHDGFEMWRRCMQGEKKAFEELMEYNRHDVLLLERLYRDIRAWDKSHPSIATHGMVSDMPVCTTCGSEDVYETDNTVSTGVSKFRVWECGDCGSQMRSRKSLLTTNQKQHLLVKAK